MHSYLTISIPFLRLVARFSDQSQVYLGVLLFALPQAVLAITPLHFYWGWYLGVVLLSFGEIILFSVINVQVDRLAPDHLKGAYFGASSLYMFGLVLAPYIGGVLLSMLGRSALFITMALLCCVIFMCYKIVITHIHKP